MGSPPQGDNATTVSAGAYGIQTDASGNIGFFKNNTEIMYLTYDGTTTSLRVLDTANPTFGWTELNANTSGTFETRAFDGTQILALGILNNRNVHIRPQIGKYDNVTTAGKGLVPIYGATKQRSESAADTNVLTYTPPATAGSYRLHFMINVSAATAATLGWTATWQDSNGTAQSPTNLDLVKNGVAAPALTFVAAAGDTYAGDTIIDIDNSATAIVCKLTFTGTSFTAKVSAFIEQLA